MKSFFTYLFVIFGFISIIKAQNDNGWVNLDTVTAGRFDTGKMWTFEYPPLKYFEEEYGFKPDKSWFDHIRMAALRFADYCSASFVSSDGLIMTNHHCARQSVTDVTREGEDLHANGFIASSLEEERPVPGLYVDQLVLIQDVTDEIRSAEEQGETEDEKLSIRSKMFEEIESRISDDTGLDVTITPLYDGGRYSVYGYKRYSDVRLVFAPEEQLGSYGGDPDNFTYPRYDLDCSFFRVYDDNGEPLKSDYYFKWSDHGPELDEPVFIVGNPGSTSRLNTVAQLEYKRDITYPRTLDLINALIDAYRSIISNDPDRKAELEDDLLNFTNSQKVYIGMLKGLHDPVLMQRKRDFEKKFKDAIQSNSTLNEKYGDVWNSIAEINSEKRKISNKRFALSLNTMDTPEYFYIAEDLIEIANELKLPENERDENFVGENLDNYVKSLFPDDFDYNMNKKLLKEKLSVFVKYLGGNNEIIEKITGGKRGNDAVEYILSNSYLTNIEDINKLVSEGFDAILNSDDPFIYFINNTKEITEELDTEMDKLGAQEDELNEKLGRALFEVYGTSIPPDATFTLRISDGVIKGFDYNGTIAPLITTYYGMYDRYYSFNKEFPWSLPERWQNPPKGFDLATPFNFVSTNDISGGSSGSPVLNKNAEVVGIAFDGNIQGLPGDFIYTTDETRCVSVHSVGMMEAFKKVYKIKRLTDELEQGHIVN
jgi:Peptidase S46